MNTKKQEWLYQARLWFKPGEKKPCAICGKYESVCEAHHIVPLSLQFDHGFDIPNNNHIWLCPTHHAIAHKMINKLRKGKAMAFKGVPEEELCLIDELIGVRFVTELYGEV